MAVSTCSGFGLAMMTASSSSASSIAAASVIGRTLETHVAGHDGVGDRRQRGARRRSNEVDVLAPHEAGSDDADANGRGLGCGHGASLHRCRCAGPNRAYGTMERRTGLVPFSGEGPHRQPADRMFHSTGHRFANRSKSVRVSTATEP